MIRISNIAEVSGEKQTQLFKSLESLESITQKIPEFDKIDLFEYSTEKYESPKVSVILPVYNVEKYLFHSMSCILNQTCREIEVICVDDCSTDSSLQILEFFALLDSRVKVIHHEKNLFAGVARNTGMAQAKGKYLYFFDPDDWCEHNLIEEAIKSGDQYESDIVILKGDSIDVSTKKRISEWGIFSIEPEPFFRKNYSGNIFYAGNPVPWGRLFRKDFLISKKIFFQDIHHSNDKYFCAMSIVLAERLSYIKQQILYHHRRNTLGGLQNSKNLSPRDPLNAFRAIKQHMDKLDISKEMLSSLQAFILNDLCIYELLLKSPRGNGFEYFFADLHSSFLKEFALDKLPHFNDQEQEKIIQAIQKNAHACDFLLDMIQYYRPFQWEKARLQGEVQGLQGEIQCLKGEIQLLQNSFSFRLGRMMTWPLRMLRNTFRSLRKDGVVFTLKRIRGKIFLLYKNFN